MIRRSPSLWAGVPEVSWAEKVGHDVHFWHRFCWIYSKLIRFLDLRHLLKKGIIKEIVELHGGKIVVESKEDEGSTFQMMLPVLTASNKALVGENRE